MQDKNIDSRKRKADLIVELYQSRKNTQKRIANDLNIPVSVVGKVTRAHSIEHTKELDIGNLNPNQRIKPFVDYEKMKYLDKYDF